MYIRPAPGQDLNRVGGVWTFVLAGSPLNELCNSERRRETPHYADEWSRSHYPLRVLLNSVGPGLELERADVIDYVRHNGRAQIFSASMPRS